MSRMSAILFLSYWQKQCLIKFCCFILFLSIDIIHNSVIRYFFMEFGSKWSKLKLWLSGIRKKELKFVTTSDSFPKIMSHILWHSLMIISGMMFGNSYKPVLLMKMLMIIILVYWWYKQVKCQLGSVNYLCITKSWPKTLKVRMHKRVRPGLKLNMV